MQDTKCAHLFTGGTLIGVSRGVTHFGVTVLTRSLKRASDGESGGTSGGAEDSKPGTGKPETLAIEQWHCTVRPWTGSANGTLDR